MTESLQLRQRLHHFTRPSVYSCGTMASDLRHIINDTAAKLGLRLKDKQFDAIRLFCSGSDVFVSLPTGYGKSVIYGILPLVFDKLKGRVMLL